MRRELELVKKHVKNTIAYHTSASFAEPDLFYLKLVERCNFRCVHCDIWKNRDPDLPVEGWKKIILSLKELKPRFNVTISGGEPLLHKDFWELAHFLHEQEIGIYLNTNGSFITPEVAEKMVRQFRKVQISLYSLKPEVQNKLRGTPIAFDRANNALEFLAASKREHPESQLNILAAFLLTSLNIDEAEEYIRHMSEKKIWVTIQSLDTNIQPLIQGKYFQEEVGGGTKSSLWIQDKDKVRQFFARAREMKRQGSLIYNRTEQLENMERYYLEEFAEIRKIPCYAGQQNFIISHNGDVFLCFKGPSVGNILEQTAVEIWAGEAARETRKLMKTCPRLCRIMNCNYNNSLVTKAREYVGSRI